MSEIPDAFVVGYAIGFFVGILMMWALIWYERRRE